MRKRNFAFCMDHLFWFFLSAFPVLCYFLCYFSPTYTPVSFDNFLPFVGCSVDTTFVYGVLLNIFGTSGVFPLFDSPELFSVLTYFINVQIIHLAVDFLLFIPRIAHSFMEKFGGSHE